MLRFIAQPASQSSFGYSAVPSAYQPVNEFSSGFISKAIAHKVQLTRINPAARQSLVDSIADVEWEYLPSENKKFEEVFTNFQMTLNAKEREFLMAAGFVNDENQTTAAQQAKAKVYALRDFFAANPHSESFSTLACDESIGLVDMDSTEYLEEIDVPPPELGTVQSSQQQQLQQEIQQLQQQLCTLEKNRQLQLRRQRQCQVIQEGGGLTAQQSGQLRELQFQLRQLDSVGYIPNGTQEPGF